MKRFTWLTTMGLAATLAACGTTSSTATDATSDLRSISSAEAITELSAVGDAITAYYGPLAFKEQRFGFDLKAEMAAAKAKISAGKTEGDFVRPVVELLAKLHDSHVSYQYVLPGDAATSYRLALIIAPYEGQFVVEAVDPAYGLAHGDVIVSIDGMTPAQIDQIVAPLVGEGNPETEAIMRAYMITQRPFYIQDSLIPTSPTAHIIVTKADGTQTSVDVPWEKSQTGLLADMGVSTSAAAKASVVKPNAFLAQRANYRHQQVAKLNAGLNNFAELNSFWMSSATTTQLGMQAVTPKPETLAALSTPVPPAIDPTAQTQPFTYLSLGAYKYTFEGKTIMVVRIPSFEPAYNANNPNEDTTSENIGWLAALLKDNLGTANDANGMPPADVVVLDETDNPGGDVVYALGIASLFATQPIPSLSEAVHPDRQWLMEYGSELAHFQTQSFQGVGDFMTTLQGREQAIESAYDANKQLSDFLPLCGDAVGPNAPSDVTSSLGGNMLPPNVNMQWNKPVLVLHDALSVSCADFFPAILQNAGVAKTFGVRTMGGGGNVETVLTQTHSGAQLNLTRGMGGPYNPNGTPKLIENEGVTPDFAHPNTIADLRAGFTDYATSFSHVAATLTR